MQQSLVTLAIPFSADAADVRAHIAEHFGNPAKDDVKKYLDKAGIVHFMSITVPPLEGCGRQLVIEFSADSEAGFALERVSDALSNYLIALLKVAGHTVDRGRLTGFLARHRIKVGQGWFTTPGLDYTGTPGMTVWRLQQEQGLASTVAKWLDDMPRTRSALETLQAVRAKLWEASEKWAFTAEPAPCLQKKPAADNWKLYARLLLSGTRVLLWPFLLAAAIPMCVVAIIGVFWPMLLFLGIPHHFVLPLFASFTTALWATAVIVAAEMVLLGVAYFRLLWLEKHDIPQDRTPNKAAVDAAMAREAFAFQNHLAASSTIKPGRLRMFTLRIGLWIAGQIGVIFSRPSFLGDTGVIHFARWVVLPKTRTLLFFSNYDGAWESYIEDFIEEAHFGVTGIWSNTVGFPRTNNLFFQGAVDGDRLRRWTRRQQYPSLFWYTAYPKLTLARMRTNAAIRQGIACAATEAEAADWLACFGSSPRPADSVESDEITTLAFGGLKHMPFGKCLLLRLPDDKARACEWLKAITDKISYGSTRHHDTALVAGFSAHGLRKLGLTANDVATFPVAFQDGMHAEWRARALGDDPKADIWGRGDRQTDAVLLLYARSEERLGTFANELAVLDAEACVRNVAFASLTDPRTEPFGFTDGISQPVLRGVGPWTKRKDNNQLVEPGEIILGYTDNAGYIPPSPSIPASADPRGILPSAHWDKSRQRPDFSMAQQTRDRDFGCNGTFLVVRQLEQDCSALKQFLADTAAMLTRRGTAPSGMSPEEVEHWIAAKMVGRWKNGSSLVRHPHKPGPAPDNEFALGTEDETGQRCPFGAHIRRSNPRDTFDPGSELELKITNRHRILRVGRPYKPENGWNPGLVFMCLNADIERQFEFVQQTWIRGSSFNALEDEMDPIVGSGPDDAVFTIPLPAGPPLRLTGLKQFVTLLGGEYFFVPGRRAVDYLVAYGGNA